MIDDWTYAAIKILIKSLMAVLLAFLVYYLGYREGSQVTGSKYDKMLIDMDLKSQERYRALLDSQNTEITAYLDRIAELNAQHDADVEALADAHFKDSIIINADADDSKCDGCQSPRVIHQECIRPPIDPILYVIPSQSYSERLQRVWISQETQMSSEKNTRH